MVEHYDITKSLRSTLYILEMTDATMNLKELIDQLFAAKLVRNARQIGKSLQLFLLSIVEVVSEVSWHFIIFDLFELLINIARIFVLSLTCESCR